MKKRYNVIAKMMSDKKALIKGNKEGKTILEVAKEKGIGFVNPFKDLPA